jgi:hypothetical protein
MTAMDKKINKLNEKLGRKTGIDFKESAKVIAKETYANKPLYFGILAGVSAFLFTSAGIFVAPAIGFGVGYAYKVIKLKEGKK